MADILTVYPKTQGWEHKDWLYLVGIVCSQALTMNLRIFSSIASTDTLTHSMMAHVMHLQIRDGKGTAVLKKDQITRTFKNINELVGSSLYVSVSVLTETGKHLSIYL